MKRLFIFILFCISISAVHAIKPYRITKKNYLTSSVNLKYECRVAVDSVVFTDEYTRLYGKLYGKPHTSCKIEDITICVEKTNYQASDVEGFDLKRWFQWEDSGIIPIEIDFSPMKATDNFTLTFSSSRQIMTWSVTNKNKRK